MTAITYRACGAARDVLSLETFAPDAPQAGEVTVDLAFSGVNPSDVKARAGSRPMTAPMIIPHSDGAGVISAVGDEVDPARIGERVWIWNGQWQRAHGTAATQITLPEGQAVALPNGVELETGATLGIPGLTACYTVFSAGEVHGKTVLVQGGAGTVGHLAIQLAKWGGATVIATAGPTGQEHAAKAGADHVLDYSAPDLAAQILKANQGRPVNHIVEVEFGENAQLDTDVIAENGTITAYGSAKNMSPTLPFYPLMFKAVTLEMALIYLLTPDQRADTIARLTRALEDNALNSPIAQIFDLADCAGAHEMVEAGKRHGSVLVRL